MGTTPELQISSSGLTAEGSFTTIDNKIAGYIFGDENLNGLEKWQVTEITKEQFLTLAQEVNPAAELNPNGTLKRIIPNASL